MRSFNAAMRSFLLSFDERTWGLGDVVALLVGAAAVFELVVGGGTVA